MHGESADARSGKRSVVEWVGERSRQHAISVGDRRAAHRHRRPKLKLKWAFGFPKGVTNNAQPTIVSGRVFVASDNGYTYSLDARTGCVYWSFQNGSIVRNSPMVGAVSGQGTARWAVFFGDGHANVFALDAQTGRQLWKTAWTITSWRASLPA